MTINQSFDKRFKGLYNNFDTLTHILQTFETQSFNPRVKYTQMPSTINVKQLDQSSWVCYQLPHNSYYYGEVGYLDEAGIVHPKQSAQASANPKNRLVKHGFGVYLLKINQQTSLPQMKYQGYWDKDEKSGKGFVKYQNGLSYEGNFHQGHYHSSGKMSWPSGETYDGNWKRSKMDGSGVFKHPTTGLSLKGTFKNNYFLDDNVLRNPFMGEKEYAVFKKQRNQIIKQKEKQQKVKHGFAIKIDRQQVQILKQSIEKSTHNNRVPFILSTKASQYTLQGLLSDLQHTYPDAKTNIFDLRRIYSLKNQQKFKYRQELHEQFRNSVSKGEIFIISLDQSVQQQNRQFKQMFYPDIKQFYQTSGFNSISWSRDQLQLEDVKKRLLRDLAKDIHQNYRLLVWTKLKVDTKISQEYLVQMLQSKFEKIVPFIKMDCLVITQPQNI